MAKQEQMPMAGLSEDSHLFDKTFDAVAEEALDFYHVPGLAIGVIHKSKTYAKGYGYSNLETRTPVKPNTLFYAGSTTKSFTAAALSLLISKSSEYQGIDWTTPISSIIPEDFVLSDDWATKHITFEDALSHRSGYPRHDRSYGGNPENTTLSSVVRALRNLPMTAEPRTVWQYQNVMFGAVSLAIEKMTGQNLKDFLREQIWEPLGMKSTFFTHEDAVSHIQQSKDAEISLAKPYLWIPSSRSNLTPLTTRSEGDHFAAIPYDLPYYVSGAGANITTVLDYVRFLDCMIRQAPPIPQSAHVELRKPRIPVFSPFLQTFSDQPPSTMGPPQYGLGWIYDVYAPKGTGKGGVEIYHHGGGLHGFNAEMRYIPALELGVVTLGNANPGGHQAGEVIFWELVDNLMGVERKERFDFKKENIFREQMGAKDARRKKDSLFGELASKEAGMMAGLEAHEGDFAHPAYARVKVSVAQRHKKDGEGAGWYLLVTASPRTWNFVVELTHIHEEIFMAEIIDPYPEAEANLDAGPGQVRDRSRAMFKLGQNGQVQSFGIELDDAMVANASKSTKKGEEVVYDWEAIGKGMIWFERASKG